MKKRILLLSLLGIGFNTAANDSHNANATSKSFFAVNPQYSLGRPEHLSLYRQERMVARKDGEWGCLQGVVFGGKSTKSKDLARYFMPFNKCCLKIAEGPSQITAGDPGIYQGGAATFKDDTYDILAQNFNIQTLERNFQSTICFCPQQKYAGGAFNYRQSISDNEEKGLWFDITIPILHVKNCMGLTENITSESAPIILPPDLEGVLGAAASTPVSGSVENMKKAFNQSSWKYGKISPCALEKTGVADIEARIGYESVREDMCRYEGFLGVIFPTGNHVKGKYVFEPIVGRGHHWGILWGSGIGFDLWQNDHAMIQIAIDTYSNYLFEAKEVRSFDIVDKQWSRYINVFTDSTATTTTPGINTFTKCMKIKPRGTYQINTAFIFKYKKFDLELGFNGLSRQSEEGCLACKWEEGPAIAGVDGAEGLTPASSMNNANMRIWNYTLVSQDIDYSVISSDFNSNTAQYKPLKLSDLNLNSALHPSTLAYTAYGALGYNCEEREYPCFAGLGASYQFSADNTSMTRWSVWGKVGVSI
jgi:hypothetical protein